MSYAPLVLLLSPELICMFRSWSDNNLTIGCKECHTKGTIVTRLFENENDTIDSTISLGFIGVKATFDIEVKADASASYSVNLFTSNTPIGLGWHGFSVGIVFYLDLVIALTAEVDLQAGFTLQLPEDALLEAKLFGGDLTHLTFDGTTVSSLPITVWSGNATLTADLQLRAQVGVETDIQELGVGAGAELGIYANMVEFGVAVASSNECALETEEWVNLNVGAYAELDVEVAWMTFGVVPTVSTTLFAAPTWTQCWDGPIASGLEAMIHGTATSTSMSTASAIAAVTAVPSSSKGRFVPSSGHASSVASFNYANSSAHHAASAFAQYSTTATTTAITTATTTTYTITSCAASVANCPTAYQQTIVATGVFAPRSSSSASPLAVLAQTTAANLTALATPVVQTYVPPSTLIVVAIKTITAQAHYAPTVATSTLAVSTATSPSAPDTTTTTADAASSGCNALVSLSPLEAALGAFESALGIFEAAVEAEKTAHGSAGSSSACGLSVSTVTASFWQTQTMTVYQPTTVTVDLVIMTVYASPSTTA